MLAMPSPRNCFSSDLKTVYGERVPDTTHTGSNHLEKSVFPDIVYMLLYIWAVCHTAGTSDIAEILRLMCSETYLVRFKSARLITDFESKANIKALRRERMAQYQERSPPTNLARVSFRPGAICRFSLLLVFALLRGLSPSSPVFLASQKPTLQIAIRPG